MKKPHGKAKWVDRDQEQTQTLWTRPTMPTKPTEPTQPTKPWGFKNQPKPKAPDPSTNESGMLY